MVRLLSPSGWKPCTKKNPKDKSLIPSSITITEQVETLYQKKNPKDRSLILGLITITEQVETLYQKIYQGQKPDFQFDHYHQAGGILLLKIF